MGAGSRSRQVADRYRKGTGGWCAGPARTLATMNPEPLRMPDGHVWYFDHSPETQLYTITVTTAEGEVCSRMTMTRDDVRRFADTMAGALDSVAAGTAEPGIVVTEDTIVVIEVESRGTEDRND
jgi:hypothetical protein